MSPYAHHVHQTHPLKTFSCKRPLFMFAAVLTFLDRRLVLKLEFSHAQCRAAQAMAILVRKASNATVQTSIQHPKISLSAILAQGAASTLKEGAAFLRETTIIRDTWTVNTRECHIDCECKFHGGLLFVSSSSLLCFELMLAMMSNSPCTALL
jgi:hypothetical protein